MTTELPVDVDLLREEIQKTYTSVSEEQDRDFVFPTGRAWAQELGRSRNIRMAVNQDIASADTAVKDGDEIAFFPPVTGG